MALLDGNRQSTRRGAALACIAVFCALPALLRAATETAAAPKADSVDQSALFRDLTLTRNADNRITMAMWLPDEFWRAVLKASGRMTDKGVDDFVAVVRPYTLVAVLDAQRGITAYRYADMDALQGEATIEDMRGATYSPLAADSVAEEVRNLIQTMRPLLANMMGAMGQHMEFLIFPSTDKTGHRIADPKSDGSLTIHLSDVALRYRLPLGSILPATLDPKTGESFPGNYHFNPYTGGKLVQRPSDGQAASSQKPQ